MLKCWANNHQHMWWYVGPKRISISYLPYVASMCDMPKCLWWQLALCLATIAEFAWNNALSCWCLAAQKVESVWAGDCVMTALLLFNLPSSCLSNENLILRPFMQAIWALLSIPIFLMFFFKFLGKFLYCLLLIHLLNFDWHFTCYFWKFINICQQYIGHFQNLQTYCNVLGI